MEDKFFMERGRGVLVQGYCSGGNASNGEQWGAADEALLACQLLTSCHAAQFLTGYGPVLVRGPGVGDPCSV